MTTAKRNWAEEIGRNAFAAIAEMVDAASADWEQLEHLRDCEPDELDEFEREQLRDLEAEVGDCEDQGDAEQRILDDPLSVGLGGWWETGTEPEAQEYRVLLTTGGPAVRIVGDIGLHGGAESAAMEVQDWGKPWTTYPCDQSILLEYVSRLYLGE